MSSNTRNAGATVAVTGRADRFRSWLSHHQRVFFQTVRELVANPVASLMTWLVIGIALALPAILYVMLLNVSSLSGEWGGKPRISLYLAEDVTLESGRDLAVDLQGDPRVQVGVRRPP